eukprot:scaffold235666_cov31-Tisochrysis_lutea.AAC.3
MDSLLAFSPSRDLLAEAAPDGRLQLWDSRTSELRQQLLTSAHLTLRATCLAWHEPKGAAPLVAVGFDNGCLLVWDLARGELAHELKGHTQPVLDVLFAGASGGAANTLYSSGADRQVCVWSAATGDLLNTTKAGKVAVHRLALSPDGAYMLLCGSAMRLVRLQGWKRVSRLAGHAEPVRHVSFSPDGKYALSSSGDRHFTLWSVSYSTLATADHLDQSIGSVALDASVVGLGFHSAKGDSLSFFVLSADGQLGVWIISASGLAPSSKARKGRSTSAPQITITTQPSCTVAVAADPSISASLDPQRISCAAFSAENEIIAAYGSAGRPAFMRVAYILPNGNVKSNVSLPRVENGALAKVTEQGSSTKGKAKRSREELPQQLGAMDMALPSASLRQRSGTLDHESTPLPPEAAAAIAALESEAAAAAAAEKEEAKGRTSFGDRLASIGSVRSDLHEGQEQAGSRKKPTASSQVALLVQALQNGDHVMLDQALQVQDAHVISSTVARLPVTSVLPFMQAVLQRIQGKPARVATLASWLRALLSTHAAYLMSCSQVTCRCRCTRFPSLPLTRFLSQMHT